METNFNLQTHDLVDFKFTSGWNPANTQQAQGIFMGYELVDHDNIIKPFNPSLIEQSKGVIAVIRCGYENVALYYWNKPLTDLEHYNNSNFESITVIKNK